MSNWENRIQIHLWDFISSYHMDRASYPNGDDVKKFRTKDWCWIIELDANGKTWINIHSVFDELHAIAYNQARIKELEKELRYYKQDTRNCYDLIKRIRTGDHKKDEYYYGYRDRLMVG